MKCKYCFLRHPQCTNAGDYVYCVWVGSSLREQTKKTLVEEYCKDVGMYFKKWSCLVDSALEMAYHRFQDDRNKLSRPYIILQININELYQRIIDDSLDSFENQSVLDETEKFKRFWNTSEYSRQHNKSRSITPCHPNKRKYLSDADSSEVYKAAMALLGLFGLFLIDAAVSSILNWLFNGSF